MITFAGLFLIAAQAPVVGEDLAAANRIQVQSALVRAQVAIDAIGHCGQVTPSDGDWETRYDGRLGRLFDMMNAADELYEIDVIGEAIVLEMDENAPPCSEASLQVSVAQADRALDEAASLIGIDAAPRSEGLWLGALRLCGERVINIETEETDRQGENQRLVFRLSEAFGRQVEAYTRTRVGKSVSFLLNGATISAPIIREPLGVAGLSVDMPDGYSVELFRRAVSSGC